MQERETQGNGADMSLQAGKHSRVVPTTKSVNFVSELLIPRLVIAILKPAGNNQSQEKNIMTFGQILVPKVLLVQLSIFRHEAEACANDVRMEMLAAFEQNLRDEKRGRDQIIEKLEQEKQVSQITCTIGI